ncbi:nicotinate phosphoribosyltransferase [Candidatus Manganitrophus noduliformans]|uniref:Nicotinate phosphoribosyltransferase n=1 Tax=Candidatus Manganitrophus noduliformans TaxID=2606439 RepID=A0A7X6I9S8_9BACT|nr:nicotinate phosphoribosyltransferase [Candidatus Manganitrophus noduliformans]NKE69803.1 nicotinate phosphoribosyltransferase [Candidatus Manganitrophus noduliformans]
MSSSVLLTDLYQLTMLQGYFEEGMAETAVFEFFVRKKPPERNFFIAAGLEPLLAYLESLQFSPEELAWLAETGRFSRGFIDDLSRLRFAGDVDAMPEGTVFFPNEPIVRVTAPLPQAQLIETRLINLLHLQILIASKAARSVLVAPGKLLIDFGLRRAHGAEAGLTAARASYLAGFAGSSNVLAEFDYGIPSYGTMAHSFIQAHEEETEAFLRFAHAQPDNVVLLIDTYDTEEGAAKVVSIAPRLKSEGIEIKGVRLDSGDLADHAKKVRRILDEGGLPGVKIWASGSLDEQVVRDLLGSGAPIDGFGIGSRLDTSADVPYLDCAYKLQEYAGRARRKRSEGKATWPGRKQVYRRSGPDGRIAEDLLTLESDPQEGEALLQPVMRAGRRLAPSPSLTESRRRAAAELARLPEPLRRLEEAPPYRVKISEGLQRLAAEVDARSG